MTWSNVCAVLPVVCSQPDRLANAGSIQAMLARQCPGLVVVSAPQWWEETPSRALAFERIGTALQSVIHGIVLYLEDDAILSDGFGAGLRQTIDECLDLRARTAVSLFAIDHHGDGYRAAARPFCYAQCLVMPAWLAKVWGRALLPWAELERTQQYRFAPDICFGEVCDAHGVELLVRYPSLVQHAKFGSACGHTHCPQSPTFR